MPDLRILFVDDEPEILSGLRRMLAPRRNDWDMAFVGSGADALAEMASADFDVVVTDMRMPGMTGAELLAEVAKRHPGAARIILSGAASESDMLLSTESAHQYLAKPCERERLEDVIERARILKRQLDPAELFGAVSIPNRLPAFPTTTTKLVQEAQSDDPSLERLAAIAAEDAALSAKLLQLVNSSFFGLARDVADPREAAKLLGSSRVVSLSLGSGLYSQIPPEATGYFFDRLWARSVAIASGAERIGLSLAAGREIQGLCYMSGLLSVTGTLVLASGMTARYLSIANSATQIATEDDVKSLFGATSAQFAAYILGLWGLPATVVEAVAFHRTPSSLGSGPGRIPLTAVHIAAVAVEAAASGVDIQLDEAFLSDQGLLERVPELLDVCRAEVAA